MRLLVFVLSLLGTAYATAAIAPLSTPITDEVVLDDELIESEGEEIVLTAEDHEFLNSDDEVLFADAHAAKLRAFKERDMSMDVYHEILDSFEDISEDIEFDASDEAFLNASIKLPEGPREAKVDVKTAPVQKK